MFNKSLFVFTVLITWSAHVISKEPSSSMLVTGSVNKSTTPMASLAAYTITRNDISQSAFSTAVDILRRVPGINVTQQGGEGGLTFVSMRGGDPNFTSVIIDGVRVNDSTNSRGGGFDFSGLDYQLIDTVEVYFGGYSPVFGSEALGGVISITTLGVNDESDVHLAVELGEQSSHAESVHITTTIANAVDISLAGSYREGGDFIEGDSLHRKQFIFKAQPKYSNKLDWSVSYFKTIGDASSFSEDSGGDQLAVIRTPEERQFNQDNVAGSLSYDVNDFWAVSLQATQAIHKEEIDNPGIAPGFITGTPPIISKSDYRRRDISLTNTLKLPSGLKLGIGAELTDELGQFDSVIDFGFPIPASFELQRDTNATFGEVFWEATENLLIVTGIRYDNAEGANETTSRFITKYQQPSVSRSFSFQYSEGFKLPSFFALGHPLIGNINLKPEQSRNVSIDMVQGFYNQKATASISLFRNQFKDLVDFDPVLFANVNRSSVTAEGATFEISLSPTKEVSVDSHVTYTNYTTDAGVKLRRRPEWASGIALHWKVEEGMSLNVEGSYVGSFYDSSIPTGLIKLDGYTDFDIIARKSLYKGVEVSLIANNVLNNGYQETVGFSNKGRELRLITSLDF